MSAALETNESRDVFRRSVVTSSPVWDDPPPWGEVYVCPRCGWQSKGMKHRTGAEWQGEKHALVCKPRTVREAEQASGETGD